MKATGIVRKIDELGRVVIPKEIRRIMRIHESDPLEIFTGNNGEVIFKKYSPLVQLGSIGALYAEVLHNTSGYVVAVCNTDRVVAVAGIPEKEILERRVSEAYNLVRHKNFSHSSINIDRLRPVEGIDMVAIVSAPIIAAGTVCGSICLLAENNAVSFAGNTEMKLIATAAAFLGLQMEG